MFKCNPDGSWSGVYSYDDTPVVTFKPKITNPAHPEAAPADAVRPLYDGSYAHCPVDDYKIQWFVERKLDPVELPRIYNGFGSLIINNPVTAADARGTSMGDSG